MFEPMDGSALDIADALSAAGHPRRLGRQPRQPLRPHHRAPTDLGMAREATSRLLAADPGIDAMFCSSDLLAMGVLYEASARAIPVPDRLAVMGFGGLGASAHTHPSLTTVAVDGARIGRETARLLLARFDGTGLSPKEPQVLDVGSYVIARASS